MKKANIFIIFIGAFCLSICCADTYDVLVAYTSNAETVLDADDDTSIGDEINAYINGLNLVQSISSTGISFNLVHIMEVSYTESSGTQTELLERLKGTSDGYMDNVHSARTEYGADIVLLYVDGPSTWVGNAYALTSSIWNAGNRVSQWEDKAFAWADVNHLGSYWSATVIGILFGAGDSAGTFGLFNDSKGFVTSDGKYQTLLGYTTSDYLAPVYSGPSVTFDSYTMGNSTHDNSDTLDTTGPVFDGAVGTRDWIWDDSIEVHIDGWRLSDWFGWITVEDYPWLYHLQHGWIYGEDYSQSSFWFWDDDIDDWVWTSDDDYPDMLIDGDWYSYLEGTDDPRYFWDYTNSQWVTWASNSSKSTVPPETY